MRCNESHARRAPRGARPAATWDERAELIFLELLSRDQVIRENPSPAPRVAGAPKNRLSRTLSTAAQRVGKKGVGEICGTRDFTEKKSRVGRPC